MRERRKSTGPGASADRRQTERRRHVRIPARLLVSWGERDDVFEGELSLSGASFLSSRSIHDSTLQVCLASNKAELIPCTLVACQRHGTLYRVRVKYLTIPPGLGALLEEHRASRR